MTTKTEKGREKKTNYRIAISKALKIPIETVGDISVTHYYWECNCNLPRIHDRKKNKCLDCGGRKENCPDARAGDVQILNRSAHVEALVEAARYAVAYFKKPTGQIGYVTGALAEALRPFEKEV